MMGGKITETPKTGLLHTVVVLHIELVVRRRDTAALFDKAVGYFPDPLQPISADAIIEDQIAIAEIRSPLGFVQNIWGAGQNLPRVHWADS